MLGRLFGRVRVLALVGALVLVATGCTYVARVSVTSRGAQAAAASGLDGLSRDGRFALVASYSQLAPSADSSPGYYRRDNVTGAVVRVDVADDGFHLIGGAGLSTMSGDGRIFAFVTNQALDPDDQNTTPDVYVRNIAAGTTTLESVKPDGSSLGVLSIDSMSISNDGRKLAFNAGIYPDGFTIIVRDLQTKTSNDLGLIGAYTRVTLSGDGNHLVAANRCLHSCSNPALIRDLGGTSYPPLPPAAAGVPYWDAISDNGRYLTGGASRLDRTTGQLLLMPDPQPFNASSHISGDGRFLTLATNSEETIPRPPGWPYRSYSLYLWDTASGAVRHIDVNADGDPSNGEIAGRPAALARTGRYVGFTSYASNLVPNDTNNVADAFVSDGAVPHPTSVSTNRPRGASHVPVVVRGGFILKDATADFGPGITVESSSTAANGARSFVISIAASAAPGLRDITITNPGILGPATGTCSKCFRVT